MGILLLVIIVAAVGFAMYQRRKRKEAEELNRQNWDYIDANEVDQRMKEKGYSEQERRQRFDYARQHNLIGNNNMMSILMFTMLMSTAFSVGLPLSENIAHAKEENDNHDNDDDHDSDNHDDDSHNDHDSDDHDDGDHGSGDYSGSTGGDQSDDGGLFGGDDGGLFGGDFGDFGGFGDF